MIKAVLFDFFDVFRTDGYKSWLTANNIPREGAYFEVSRRMDMGDITPEQFLEELGRLQGHPVTLQDLDENAMLNDEVVAIAETLKENYQIALLSNAPSAFIRPLFTEHNLERLFHEIIVSSEVGMVKPNADIFELALQKLGVRAAEAIFIDDNEMHVQGAESVGIKGIQFVSATQLRCDLLDQQLLLDDRKHLQAQTAR